jgi:branched-chain amino acid transport system permease protein
MYLNPDTVSGIAVSLQIVFAAIAGGMYSMFGPTIGALLTISLTEGLRVSFGTSFVGAANAIYGILLVLFVIFMPRGIVGWLETVRGRGEQPVSEAEIQAFARRQAQAILPLTLPPVAEGGPTRAD